MSRYTELISNFDFRVKRRLEIEQEIIEKEKELKEMEAKYVDMVEALSVLSTVSDDNTKAVLDYITGVINKALKEIFPYDTRRIYLEKRLHAGQYTHINVILEDGSGHKRNMALQSGTGLRQIVSFLYAISLIEIRKGRRIFIMDELLSGLHKEAKDIIMSIMKIFAEEGFQFVMVEYGVDDVGKIYLVEKPNGVATVTSLDGDYTGQVFQFTKPDGLEELNAMQEVAGDYED